MSKLFIIASALLLFSLEKLGAQTDTVDLVKQLGDEKPKREFVSAAFKSSRVINGHSIEFIGKGVLDVRILHRFGYLDDGVSTLFGLDEASMRMGLDYGLGKNFTIGVGRSTLKKELDRDNKFSSRLGYYHQLILGRKFNERFSLQLAPLFVHRNLIDSVKNSNDTWALGIGGRMKISKRVALVLDYHPILSGKQEGTYDPLSVGFDIETGGHVFQLHFSNATGMNEKEFITNTTGEFWKGEIRFGFNLSRVFSLGRPVNYREK
jgi:hypothetical protein